MKKSKFQIRRYLAARIFMILTVGVVGFWLLSLVRGATFSVSDQAENSSLTGMAARVADPKASGGVAVKFGTTVPPLTGHPGSDYPAVSGWESACVGTSSSNCDTLSLQSINNAHVREGRPPIVLPLNYASLEFHQKELVVTNLERSTRGLPAFTGNSSYDAMALSGAQAGGDPNGPGNAEWGSNWQGNVPGVLAANFSLMYQDSDSQWGHRDNILVSWGGSMGSALATSGGEPSLTQLFVRK